MFNRLNGIFYTFIFCAHFFIHSNSVFASDCEEPSSPSSTQSEQTNREDPMNIHEEIFQMIRGMDQQTANFTEQSVRKTQIKADKRKVNRVIKEIVYLLESRHGGVGSFFEGARKLHDLTEIHKRFPLTGSVDRFRELEKLQTETENSRKVFEKLPKIRITPNEFQTALNNLGEQNVAPVVINLLNAQFIDREISAKTGGLFLGVGLIFSLGVGAGFGTLQDSFGRTYIAWEIQNEYGQPDKGATMGPYLGVRYSQWDQHPSGPTLFGVKGKNTGQAGAFIVGVGTNSNEGNPHLKTRDLMVGLIRVEDSIQRSSRIFRILPVRGKNYDSIRKKLEINYEK